MDDVVRSLIVAEAQEYADGVNFKRKWSVMRSAWFEPSIDDAQECADGVSFRRNCAVR